jgi:hypothetical protein
MSLLNFVARWEWPDWVAEERPEYPRNRATVYLDTSIPSYLTARLHRNFSIARCQRITRIWWERYSANYELRVSPRVLAEARAGNVEAAGARMNSIRTISVLEPNTQTEALASLLVGKGMLPLKARADAEHIAIASIHSVRFLLTWNCRHMANPTIARNVVQICEAVEMKCPTICTPETLMRIYLNERSTT